jgi:hypothetical protein
VASEVAAPRLYRSHLPRRFQHASHIDYQQSFQRHCRAGGADSPSRLQGLLPGSSAAQCSRRPRGPLPSESLAEGRERGSEQGVTMKGRSPIRAACLHPTTRSSTCELPQLYTCRGSRRIHGRKRGHRRGDEACQHQPPHSTAWPQSCRTARAAPAQGGHHRDRHTIHPRARPNLLDLESGTQS